MLSHLPLQIFPVDETFVAPHLVPAPVSEDDEWNDTETEVTRQTLGSLTPDVEHVDLPEVTKVAANPLHHGRHPPALLADPHPELQQERSARGEPNRGRFSILCV